MWLIIIIIIICIFFLQVSLKRIFTNCLGDFKIPHLEFTFTFFICITYTEQLKKVLFCLLSTITDNIY